MKINMEAPLIGNSKIICTHIFYIYPLASTFMTQQLTEPFLYVGSAVDQHDEIGLLPWDVMRRKHDEELHSFIMDSVALHHMSRNREILKDYHADLHINPPIKSVTSPSDSCLPVRGIGYIDSKGGSLDRVLFVPNSDVNLVSVSQHTKDCSVRVVFSKFWFVIEKLESMERIGHGKCMDQSYVVVHLDVGAASDWILDSFAWLHHTPNRQILYYLQKKADDFSMPTGRDQLQILGHGSVQTERFKVPGVRYTEEDTRNVISVAQLAKNHRLVTIFEPTCCKVKDIETGKIIGKGHLRNGMYVLDYLRISQVYVRNSPRTNHILCATIDVHKLMID